MVCLQNSMSRRFSRILQTSNALQRLQAGRKHQTARCSKYSFNDDFREAFWILETKVAVYTSSNLQIVS